MSFNKSSLTEDMNVSATQDSYHKVNTWNIHEDFISLQTTRNIEEITSCGFHNLNFLIGSPANILNMIIFYRQGLRDRMNLCLFCLAFTDLMYLMTIFIIDAYCFIGIPFPDQKEMWKWFLAKNALNLIYSFDHTSGCVTMIIAVERCVCVMLPMKAVSIISTKTMAIILSATFILIQLLCSIYIIKEKLTVLHDAVTGENIIILTYTELYLSHSIFRIIENIVLSSISFFSFTVVCLATGITVVKLKSAMAWRMSITSSHLKVHAMLIKMLVVVSCVNILCRTPNIILALVRFAVTEFHADGRYGNLFMTTHYIANLPVMFNTSINFFVYVKMSSRFRRELQSLCVCSKQ